MDGWKIQALTVELHLVPPCDLCRIAVPWCNPLRLLVWISWPIRACRWEGTRQLTLVNSTEGRRGFKIQRPTLCCHPCSAFFFFRSPRSPVCVCSTEKGKVREGGERWGKEEWSTGQREQGQGRKWVVTSATAAMEPSRPVCFTLLTVGRLCVGSVTFSPFSCMTLRVFPNCQLICALPVTDSISWATRCPFHLPSCWTHEEDV